ncbi:MAG TPA: M14 metallopeptidase family protein [Vicinamibacterales bacterium]|nr:M14 metallopeptidase family protein [Vicinamibacterales bacterium]
MRRRTTVGCAILLLAALSLHAQRPGITTPEQALGFALGDDYQLANYTQIESYWKTLDKESDRIVLHDMGKTAEGRTQWMAIVTSPRNHRSLARYRDISRRLALAEGLTDDQARALAREGKAVVWIDGGLHATETLGAQQLAQMVYEMASRDDEETRRFLDDCIILFVHANPDGNDLVADWYMRNADPRQRSLANLPRLYQKYIGHDNNRDFFASTQPETENINRVLYHEWLPQILYNHHQSGPAGTVVWSSPQRDPYNYNLDPLLILGLQALGTHMHQWLAAEGKPGATMASGGAYDGWWNGGIRNTGNFHNIIAILTETIGSPTPMRIPLVAQRQIPSRDLPYPIAPQEWRFRQSIDYSLSFNRGVLDYASRNRENLLFNIYKMGQRSIERGSGDYWTPSPSRINALPASGQGGRGGGNPEADAAAWAALRRPELRDPRAFVVPANQPDFPTAVKFINALREVNVAVHRATAPFQAAGKSYPAGSFVVFTNQAFRPHVLDMFEPQDHPNVIPYPGAPPTRPYDNAGWTLAYQMGIEFDRVLEGFSGPFEKVTEWNVPVPRVTVPCSRTQNDCFLAMNRASKASASAAARGMRIALWDQYGGSMESGWTRWILEQFQFPFARVFAPELDAGNLNAKYDVLIFPSGAIPAPPSPAGGRPPAGSGQTGRGGGAAGPDPQTIPAEYRSQLGRVTTDKTIPQIRAFAENGGTVVAISDAAMNLAAQLKLPVENHLVENGEPLPASTYFVPGSVLAARVDTSHPLAAGMKERTDVFFDNSPVFKLAPGAEAAGVRAFARFDSAAPLRSGWAWGQKYLDGGILAIEARLGKGRVILYGPEILQRAQPHGTFKLLFNALVAGGR